MSGRGSDWNSWKQISNTESSSGHKRPRDKIDGNFQELQRRESFQKRQQSLK
jgi:hypothetical protein